VGAGDVSISKVEEEKVKTEFEYIHFVQVPKGPGAKTSSWECRNTKHGDLLGHVCWYGRWRQYCYFSHGETVLNAGCLRDIQAFLKVSNVQHYAKAEASPSACPGGKGD